MGWKKFIGKWEDPSEDDPKYSGIISVSRTAGSKTARFLRLDKFASWLQDFAEKNPKRFLRIIFVFITLVFCYNVFHIVSAYQYHKAVKKEMRAHSTKIRSSLPADPFYPASAKKEINQQGSSNQEDPQKNTDDETES